MEANDFQHIFTFDEYEKFIFFNSSDAGILKRVEGDYNKVYEKTNFLISQNNDSDSILFAQTRNESLKILDEKYNNIYITYIPAKELSYMKSVKNNDEDIKKDFLNIYGINFDKIFPLIEKPLLKISHISNIDNTLNENSQDFLECVLSGRRSSILFSEDNHAIRLKGSGNNFNGFQLGEVLMIGPNHFEIFGCQFKNTCLREQYICYNLIERLNESNFFCGNLPIGFWKYDNQFLEWLNLEMNLKEQTLGN